MTDSASSDRLDALVFQYLGRVEAGETGERVLDELCAGHPGDAEALRRGVALLREVRLHPGPAEDGLPERIGPFRLLRRLGAGGMGVVYLAEQANPSRQVAVKLVRPDQLWFEGYRERFTREIESAGRLAHPGIAPVYEMGEHDGVPWFSQEYVVGAPLSALLANVPARSAESLTGADLRAALADALEAGVPDSAWDEDFFAGSWAHVCLRIARQVADALQHAHERGVLHRDVKPSNVLLTPAGRAVLVDFGLASLQGTERLTQTGAQLGSLHYMPPEQVDGRVREIGARSDVYSLGVTLYELLTLRAPYSSQSVQRLRGMILAGEAHEPRVLNKAISRDVEVIVQSAMEPSLDRRYETAAAFAADLAAAQAHRPIAARPAGPALRMGRWVRRRPALAVALVASVLLFVVAPIVFGVQSYRAAEEQAELNRELSAALADGDTLLDATLEGFNTVVRKTAHETLEDAPGFQLLRLGVIDEALAIFERVVEARPEDVGVLHQQALMMRTRANILGLLGRDEEALEQYARAARAHEPLVALPDCDVSVVRELGSLRYQQASSERALGRPERAVEWLREAIVLQRRAIELAPEDLRNHRDLATMASRLADDLRGLGGHDEEAEALMAEAVAVARDAADGPAANDRVQRALYEALGTRAHWRVGEGRLREARADYRDALASLERARALEPDDRVLRQQQIQLRRERAHLDLRLELDVEAVALELEQTLELSEGLMADYPNLAGLDKEHAAVQNTLAYARLKADDHAGAREMYEVVVEELLARARAQPRNAQAGLDATVGLVNLTNALLFDESLGVARLERIIELCDRAEELAEPFARQHPGSLQVRQLRMLLHYKRGAVFNQLEDPDGLWSQIEELRELEHDVPMKFFMTAKLLLHWANRSGDPSGRKLAVEEAERAVAMGFEDVSSWEQSEFELECADDPRVFELGAIIRERATGR